MHQLIQQHTDPAALIPVFKQVTIKDKIKQTVVSESAFNDAVGAILVSTLLGVVTSGQFSAMESIKELLIAAGVGVIIGYLLTVFISDKNRCIPLICTAHIISNQYNTSQKVLEQCVDVNICNLGNTSRFSISCKNRHFCCFKSQLLYIMVL